MPFPSVRAMRARCTALSFRLPGLFLLPWLLLAAPTLAANPLCGGDRPIHLAFYDYGLFHFSQDGQVRGIDKAIVDELQRRSGCHFRAQVMARARIWADLASGQLDMSVSGIQTPQRDEFAWFAHYLSMKNYAILRADRAARLRQGEAFIATPRLRFGVVRAFRHGEAQDRWLDQLREQDRVEESTDAETLFRKLKAGRIDGLFSQPPVFRKALADLGMSADFVAVDWTPEERGVPHGLILAKSRFDAVAAEAWRDLIETLRADGTLLRIYRNYLPTDEAKRLLDF